MVKVVICGGGIIGCTLAYFLSLKNVEIVLIEQTDIASGASGKAGGFLAYDWCDSRGPLEKLSQKSFLLHAELAEKFGHKYFYRRVDTLSVGVNTEQKKTSKVFQKPDYSPKWIDKNITSCEIIGSTKTTAQVHPELFTKTMWDEAVEKGAKLVLGKVCGLRYDKSRVTAVVLQDGSEIAGDMVVVAMGAWSKHAHQWIPKEIKSKVHLNRLKALKANSIILRPKIPSNITAHAIFLNVENLGPDVNPEIYPRSNGDVYVCGYSSIIDLPESTKDVTCDEQYPPKLRQIVGQVSSDLDQSELKSSQACILPDPIDGLPLIGKIPHTDNLFVSTGHYCWGILNSTASALGLSELILDGKYSSIDLSEFTPSRNSE